MSLTKGISYGLMSLHHTEKTKKKRLGLVVSRYEFNRSTQFTVICPITSIVKESPTRYILTNNTKISGQVLISKLKFLDVVVQELEYVDHLSISDMEKIN